MLCFDKEEVIAIQNLLNKWANEVELPIAWKKIYLQHATEDLTANGEQKELFKRVTKELAKTRK